MVEYAIEVENLSKVYQVNPEGTSHALISEQLGRIIRHGYKRPAAELQSKTFSALKDVSFKVEKGKVVGIIGGNGSGKSTLLKILSRVSAPTYGRVIIRGRVSSLLEINVGFHSELAGRENVYLFGTIMGLTKREIDESFDEIVDFADVRKFIDTPVKHYSSGMFLRLGFAVAAHLKPDIMLVDEILAVGDAQFQRKCIGRMNAVARQGRTVLIVSHQLDLVRQLCDYCIVLNKGVLTEFSDVDEAIEYYSESLGLHELSSFVHEENPELPIQIVEGRIKDESDRLKQSFDFVDQIVIEVEYIVRRPLSDVYLEMVIYSNAEGIFTTWDIDLNQERLEVREPGRYVSTIRLPRPLLKAGHYTITFNSFDRAKARVFQRLEHVLGFEITLLIKADAICSYGHGQGRISVPLEWQTETRKQLAALADSSDTVVS